MWYVTNLVTPRLLPSRTLYVLPGETEEAATKTLLRRLAFKEAEFLDYESLTTCPTSSFRGRSVVLGFLGAALERPDMLGRLDGALVRLLASRSRRQVIATIETTSELRSLEFATPAEFSQWISSVITPKPTSDIWLNELLLELLYGRHIHLAKVKRLVSNSIWWYNRNLDGDPVPKALRALSKMNLVSEERGRYYTSTRLGRLVVERGLPISKTDLPGLEEQLDAEEVHHSVDDATSERLDYFQDLVLGLVDASGWTTVNGVAGEAARKNLTKEASRGIARRFLDSLVASGRLVRSTYRRGSHGPMFVYFRRGSTLETEVFENRCGDCVFYSKVTRRCRLWRALSRFNAAEVYSRQNKLSTVARDKLHNANRLSGPNATACNYFAPKKRDFPLERATDVCLCCGDEVDAPVAKIVRCRNCGTSYRPLANKILVSYNYEQVFRDRYLKISGTSPPSQSLLLTDRENPARAEWRDLIVLYPHENVKVGPEGISVERGAGGTGYHRYEKIFQVVDYGALTSEASSELGRKGIRVLSRSFLPEGRAAAGLFPSAGFVQNLRSLAQDHEFRRLLSESLLLSVIVATKRIADFGGPALRALVSRQTIEYERMLQERELSVTRALAYEARVNNLYWRAYKLMLKPSGLDFQSRVRDRFVRELVDNSRARARGYSPANAAINYLHQRRLFRCRAVNAELGIGWIGCEGIFHMANRKPSIGLLLDLSDSFRLADREAFLRSTLRFEVSREDFVAKLGKHRVWYFFPSADGLEKLEAIGSVADRILVDSAGNDRELAVAYQEFVRSFVSAVETRNPSLLRAFIYGTSDDLRWLELD